MTWVKICGITNLEDAQTAVDAGADALGFVFYEKSKRKVTPQAAKDIVGRLPTTVEKIGVFVDADDHKASDLAQDVGLTGIQWHATTLHPPRHRATTTPKTTLYLAFPASQLLDGRGRFKGFAWSPEAERVIRAIFLDSGTAKQPGGTGKTFDWKKARQTVQALQLNFRVVVAGGLTVTNVAEAMRILKPWGVDVSSGVEARPGKKDPEKVRAFIAAVRAADRNH